MHNLCTGATMLTADNLPCSAPPEPFNTTPPQDLPFGESIGGARVACTLFGDGRTHVTLMTCNSPMICSTTSNGGVYLTMSAEQADALERHLSVCRSERQRRAK